MGGKQKFETEQELKLHIIELEKQLKLAPDCYVRNTISRKISYWKNKEVERANRKNRYLESKKKNAQQMIENKIKKIRELDPTFVFKQS